MGIGQKAQRIGIETDMRAVLLTVAGHPLSQLSPLLRRLDADAEDLNIFRNVPLRLVNEGRHLGPAPGSPAAAIEEDDSRRRFGKGHWEFDRFTVDVLKNRRRKSFADR